MQTFIQKISSRKLWMAIAGVASGVAIALGASSGDIGTIATAVSAVIGGITALASIVTYIHTEGKLDAASMEKASSSAQSIVEAAQKIVDTVKGAEDESEDTNENAV